MATLEEMSPASLLNDTDNKGSKGFSPTCCNSSSDELLWNKLRSRTDHFVEKRKNEGLKRRSFPDEDPLLSEQKGAEEAERSRKRMKEGDSFLLLKGLDSIASSLSQLTNCLDSALQTMNVDDHKNGKFCCGLILILLVTDGSQVDAFIAS
ncbi:hypothetical protein EJ110_NYTH13817 [Nymphaea thermarum]|nr:hypothetical protein EJ110_NYTH13817 [Nymphaea thermarum]